MERGGGDLGAEHTGRMGDYNPVRNRHVGVDSVLPHPVRPDQLEIGQTLHEIWMQSVMPVG